ncbi:MAG: HIT family protein [Rhizobiaceae bacterium]
MPAYDDSNIFARILRGEIPCYKVHEDDHALAFMDVMPQANGHVLVVPKRASRNLRDADPAIFAHALTLVQKLGEAAISAFGADGYRLAQFNEAPAGQTVFHLHFHMIPAYEGVPLRGHTGAMEDKAILAANAEKMKAALRTL